MSHSGERAAAQTDTSPQARRRYVQRLRETSPADRLERALRLSERVRSTTMADVERKNPGATKDELAVAFVRRVYGGELADRLARRFAVSRAAPGWRWRLTVSPRSPPSPTRP